MTWVEVRGCGSLSKSTINIYWVTTTGAGAPSLPTPQASSVPPLVVGWAPASRPRVSWGGAARLPAAPAAQREVEGPRGSGPPLPESRRARDRLQRGRGERSPSTPPARGQEERRTRQAAISRGGWVGDGDASRAFGRAVDRLFAPGGAGYEDARLEFTDLATMSRREASADKNVDGASR